MSKWSDNIQDEINKRKKRAQKILDAQVLKDSSYFIPVDSGALKNSGINHTVLGSGRVIWATPYVKQQYYNEKYDHSTQSNPNACAKWFERAKSEKKDNWIKLYVDVYKGNK